MLLLLAPHFALFILLDAHAILPIGLFRIGNAKTVDTICSSRWLLVFGTDTLQLFQVTNKAY